jgi:hypothetical protein
MVLVGGVSGISPVSGVDGLVGRTPPVEGGFVVVVELPGPEVGRLPVGVPVGGVVEGGVTSGLKKKK